MLGRTGCGKSTLLQLLTRAWDPSQERFCSTISRSPASAKPLCGRQ
ncbi:ATP-binding cassette domain-containing protein [Klebsiella pneumoniae subsp. pneumoniae]|nr:ATP-binding cassette domain-containing protein [Klebsiella pneumoniae subsp. pneumoniae]